MAMVKRITDNDRDALIVLTSDHGSAFKLADRTGLDVEKSSRNNYYDERTSILSSWRLPTACRQRLPDDISLTNNFRFIFSCITGEQIQLLRNRHFIHSPAPSFDVREISPE